MGGAENYRQVLDRRHSAGPHEPCDAEGEVVLKKGLVIGLARSGAAAANLLVRRGWDVTVTDMKQPGELEEYISALEPGVRQSLGGHPEGLLNGVELAVVSPGVPLKVKLVQDAMDRGIEVIGELELAYRHFSDIDYYCVTGTNGKSTTVTLLHTMMLNSGRKCLLGGNIGVPLCQALDGGADYDCAVVEASSFQLDTVHEFSPRGSVVLNVTPDHMDRYGSVEAYRDSKLRCAMNRSGGDFLVLNAGDPLLNSGPWAAGDGVYFFGSGRSENAIFTDSTKVSYDFNDELSGDLIDTHEIAIKGSHNLENAMAASAVALLGGCTPGAVRQALREFRGLEHRNEFVRELDGVRYINDSKGTNVGAVLKSLESFDSPVVLIAGGRDKDGDFEALVPLVRKNVRAVVLIGEAAGKIEAALGDAAPGYRSRSMADAVRLSRELALKGDVVLLSPACASFDMFKSFEHRGAEFKREVAAL